MRYQGSKSGDCFRTSTRLLIATSALLLFSYPSLAQNQSGRRRVGDPPVVPHGTIRAIYDSFETPQSLKELVKAADVIVDGRVQSIFPGRLRQVNDPTSVETDALFAVDRVLKGTPELLRSLVITQMGGKYGDVEVVVEHLTRLNQGDQHILFLNYDRRTIVPPYPRTDGNFTIVGAWIGNFKLQDNAVKWVGPPTAETFKKFERDTAETFVAQILAEVSAAQ